LARFFPLGNGVRGEERNCRGFAVGHGKGRAVGRNCKRETAREKLQERNCKRETAREKLQERNCKRESVIESNYETEPL
jgi:hypothetical protein